MALPISNNTRTAALKTIKEPNIVLCIEGYDICIPSVDTYEVIKIGAAGLLIDGSWLIGGVELMSDGDSAISMDGTTTTIRQQLDIDKARGSSIQSMQIEIVDLKGNYTKLISPGVVIDDILGKKAKVYLALNKETALWPDDYELLFRGNIDEVKTGPATISLNIAHPEQKKKQAIWTRGESTLSVAINNSQTTIDLTDASSFLLPVLGPDLTYDTNFKTYVVIEDEVIQYTGITGNQLTGCVRGQLGTQPFSHPIDTEVVSLYRLEGDAMEVALKFMLSREGYFLEDLEPTSFQVLPDAVTVPNAIYFEGIDVYKEYGVVVGDYITTTGATNGANNVTLKEVIEVTKTSLGSYIVLDGVSFVDESSTPALLKIRSQYDVWPKALGMGGDEVDVKQHLTIRQRFLSSFLYDFYIKDTIEDGREFLDQEVYKPSSSYSIPRKTQSSVQMLIGPIPGVETKTLNHTNIVKPSGIVTKRAITKNFSNTVIYRFDEDPIEDKFLRGHIEQSATSLNQIKVGTKALVISSKGMRESLNGINLAQQAAERRLNRYEFGAESYEGVKVTFGTGFDIELGDIVIFDGSELHIANTDDGTRGKPAILCEVVDKSLNYKTGDITLSLVDTNFNGAGKYALVGPASRIKSGIDQKTFVIEQYYASIYGAAEYQKWQRYTDVAVRVRSEDGTTRYAQSVIVSANSNTITLRDNLGFVPVAGDIMELAEHDFVDTTDEVKLLYVHQAALNGGAIPPYVML